MKCSKCKKRATHDSPQLFCPYHWAKWWTKGWEKILSPAEFKKEFAEVLKTASK